MKSLRAESEFDAAAPQAQIRQCHQGKAETKLPRDFIEHKGRKGSRKGRKENPSPRSSAPTSATSALNSRPLPHPHEIASRRIGIRRRSTSSADLAMPPRQSPKPSRHATFLQAKGAKVLAKAAKKIRLRVPLRQP